MRLIEFVERQGHARVPATWREEGYGLGSWVNRQRSQYQRGTLLRQRQARLESVPGWAWDPFDEDWEEAFALLGGSSHGRGTAASRPTPRRTATSLAAGLVVSGPAGVGEDSIANVEVDWTPYPAGPGTLARPLGRTAFRRCRPSSSARGMPASLRATEMKTDSGLGVGSRINGRFDGAARSRRSGRSASKIYRGGSGKYPRQACVGRVKAPKKWGGTARTARPRSQGGTP